MKKNNFRAFQEVFVKLFFKQTLIILAGEEQNISIER
jgi:hypothetical protein